MKIMAILTIIEAVSRLVPLAEDIFKGNGKGKEKEDFVTGTLETVVAAADESNLIKHKDAVELRSQFALVPRLIKSLVGIFHSTGEFLHGDQNPISEIQPAATTQPPEAPYLTGSKKN